MRCSICKRPLNVPHLAQSTDCGGDCLQCMAEAGDPDCIAALDSIPIFPATIVLASEHHNENGYQLHGLFSCFAEALKHISKDEGTRITQWDEPQTYNLHTYVSDRVSWTASRQEVRT